MHYQLGLSGEPLSERPFPTLFQGVGLIRGEYLCRQANQYVTHRACRELIDRYLRRISATFAPDPVWYRTIDMETSELNVLDGADQTIEEPVTMLGCRGARRSCRYPDAFLLELGVVADVARAHPNLHVLVPFVSDVSELSFVKTCLAEVRFPNRLGIMAEIPSTVLCLGDFLGLGVDNVTVGMNDLTSLTLGSLRRSYTGVNSFMHPAVQRLLARAREVTRGWPGTLALAGYLDRPVVDLAAGLGYDVAVVHYSGMGEVFGAGYADLPDRVDLAGIKRRAAALIDERRDRRAVEAWLARSADAGAGTAYADSSRSPRITGTES